MIQSLPDSPGSRLLMPFLVLPRLGHGAQEESSPCGNPHVETCNNMFDVFRLSEADCHIRDLHINSHDSADLPKTCYPKYTLQRVCNLLIFFATAEEGSQVVNKRGNDKSVVFVDKDTGIKGAAS